MPKEITADILASFTERLDTHPVYQAVETIEDLQCFMRHHIYSVWDFMSLIKYLQSVIAPTVYPWVPRGDGNVRRFINELVLEEESDSTGVEGEFSSHFELCQGAMREVGADTAAITAFIDTLEQHGIDAALARGDIPPAARAFTTTTFDFIHGDQPHQVAAALAFGREHIIPGMFRSILARFGVSGQQAPIFHYYLNKHIHLDEDFHAPLSLKLLNALCDGRQQRIDEAIEAAHNCIEARIAFWDGVLVSIQAAQSR